MRKHLSKIMFVGMMLALVLAMLVSCGPKQSQTPGGGGGGGTTNYTVTFETFGGTYIEPVTVAKGSTVARPNPDPQKAHSTFVNWYADEDRTGAAYDFSTPVNSDITLYAKWDDDMFSVVFDADGGNPIPQYTTVTYGTNVQQPAAPSKLGYAFDGWYTDVAKQHRATFPYEVTQSVMFYAKWTAQAENGYTVNFKVCRSSGMPGAIDFTQDVLPPVKVAMGQKFEQPQNPEDIRVLSDENPGEYRTFKFAFWSFSDYLGTLWSRPVLFPIYNSEGKSVTLYAVYIEDKGEPLARLNVHPLNGEKDTVMYGYKGEALGIAHLDQTNPYAFYTDMKKPFYEGHEEDGYYRSQDFVASNVYEVPFMLNNDVNDVYIRWKEVPKVTVHICQFIPGQTLTKRYEEIEIPYGGLIPKPETPISPGGSVFNAFYLRTMGYEYNPLDDSTRWEFESDRVYEEIWLVADWIKSATVLMFDTNGGYKMNSVSVNPKKTYSYEDLPIPTKVQDQLYYNFIGWEYNGRLLDGDDLSEFKVEDTTTLTARWGQNLIDMRNFDIVRTQTRLSVLVKSGRQSYISGIVELPAYYEGDTIRYVQNNGFENCVNLTGIVIPNTYTVLNISAFSGCTALESVVINANHSIAINMHAFMDCTSLTSFSKLKYAPYIVGYAPFKGCTQFIESHLQQEDGFYYMDTDEGTVFLGDEECVNGTYGANNSVTELTPSTGGTLYNKAVTFGQGSLRNLGKLSTLALPDCTKYLSGECLPDDRSVIKALTLSKNLVESTWQINWPDQLETLSMPSGNAYFYMESDCLVQRSDMQLVCSTLSAKQIPTGVQVIGDRAFANKKLDTVQIPTSVNTFNNQAFYKSEFTHLDIPDSVGRIDATALEGCSNMVGLAIGSGSPKLESRFFTGMRSTSMADVNVSANNAYIKSQDSVVYDKETGQIVYIAPRHSGEVRILDGALTLGENFDNLYNGFRGDYSTLYLPDSITELPEFALEDAKNIGTLHLGAGIPEINAYRLFGTLGTAPSVIEVSADNPNMRNIDGAIYNTAGTKLLMVGTSVRQLSIPETVQKVENGINLHNLDTLTLPKTFTREMFDRLFYGYSSNEANDDDDKEWVSEFKMRVPGDRSVPTATANSVVIDPQNDYLAVFGGAVFTKDLSELVYMPMGIDGTFELPAQMTETGQDFATKTSKFMPSAHRFGCYFDVFSFDDRSDEYAELQYSTVKLKVVAPEGSQLTTISTSSFSSSSSDFAKSAHIAIEEVDFTKATQLNKVQMKAFGFNDDIVAVKLPSTELVIESYAFFKCKNLATLEVDFSKVTFSGSFGAFGDCPKLFDEQNKFVSSGYLIMWEADGAQIGTAVDIPADVQHVLANSVKFSGVYRINIPSSVLTIGKEGITINSTSAVEIYIDQEAIPEGFSKDVEGQDNWYSSAGIVAVSLKGADATHIFAKDPVSGFYFELDSAEHTATLLDDHTLDAPLSGEVTLPASLTYDGQVYAVTAIGKNAFGSFMKNSADIERLIVPEGVITIGDNAFSSLKKLTYVSIADSVTTLGSYMFESPVMTEAIFGEGVTVVPDNLFRSSGTKALERLTFRGQLTSIGDRAFARDTKGTYSDLVFTADISQVTKIGSYALCNVKLVNTDISFTQSAIEFGAFAFAMAGAVTETEHLNLHCNNATLSFGNYVFQSAKLMDIVFYDIGAISQAGEGVFQKTYISGEGISAWIAALQVNEIPKYTFSNCQLLSSKEIVHIASNITTIGNEAFSYSGRNSEEGLRIEMEEGISWVKQRCFYNSYLKSLTVPASLTKYGYEAFKDCNYLTSLTFAVGTSKVGYTYKDDGKSATPSSYGDGYGFAYAPLKTVVFKGDSEALNFAKIDIQASCFACAGDSSGMQVTFEEGAYVKKMGDYAFYYSKITELNVAGNPMDGLTVGTQCFAKSNLQSATFSNKVNLGKWAFYTANKLRRVEIKKNFNSVIGEQVFRECNTLSEVVFGSDTNRALSKIGDWAFYMCPSLKSITLPKVTTMGSYIFSGNSDMTITVPYTEDTLPSGWLSSITGGNSNYNIVYAG